MRLAVTQVLDKSLTVGSNSMFYLVITTQKSV